MILFTEYYKPAYKAGGLITSISNLYTLLSTQISITIVSSAFDLNEKELLPEITPDSLINNCYFSRKSIKSILRLCYFIKKNNTELFYINGIYTWHLSLLPAILGRNLIIAPRGMLQKSSFEQRGFFKKIYLSLYKRIIINKKVLWHATSAAEVQEIQQHIGHHAPIKLIHNIPSSPIEKLNVTLKRSATLKLVCLALVGNMKNHLRLIKLIQDTNLPIELDLYGPIKDHSYWAACLQLMNTETSVCTIQYKGILSAHEVPMILQQYHASILLSKGENFGHAIFESLSVGRSVILSDKTPWKFENTAGSTFADDEDELIIEHLRILYNEDQSQWNQRSSNALQYAKNYLSKQNFITSYLQLFQCASL